MARTVLLYTVSSYEAEARRWLAERGLGDAFELVSVLHEPYQTPDAALLRRVRPAAVLGEFMPVAAADAPVFAEAGVRLVASMSIGLNHVDVAALAAASVLTTNCPGYCAPDVALHAVALMLDLMRQVTASNLDVRGGAWNPDFGYPMRRPQGLTCGLVFFGRIAQEVVPLVQALGMHVVVWAPTKGADELAAHGCEKAETLDDLLRASDVVSLHCPLIPQTEWLIGARELALMKPTAFLVNTARGGVVDEDALAAALETGAIQAAALDVLTNEQQLNKRLVNAPNCVITPHTAYVSEEARQTLLSMSLQSVRELLVDGRTPANVAR